VSPEFDDLVDAAGLSPDEEGRLRRVHDLLIEAGPPPDLPPALEHGPEAPPEGEIAQFPLLPRRRLAVSVVLAAALAAAAFGVGFLVGDQKQSNDFASAIVVPMTGPHGAVASIRLPKDHDSENWPMELIVSGLPKQPEGAYYTLYLTRGGKPIAPCGFFRVNGKTTTVHLNAPYQLRKFDGWVVTYQPKGVHTPGRVVMTT
jgi:hypothetical protein